MIRIFRRTFSSPSGGVVKFLKSKGGLNESQFINAHEQEMIASLLQASAGNQLTETGEYLELCDARLQEALEDRFYEGVRHRMLAEVTGNFDYRWAN